MAKSEQQPIPDLDLPAADKRPSEPPPAAAQPAPPPEDDEDEAEEERAIVRDAASRTLSAFADQDSFVAGQRMAKALAASTLMPAAYQGNIPNVLIAMELANRIGASVIMVAQNLDIIHGRPSWRAQFLIATVNACGRFTPLRFKWQGTPGKDDWGCRAVAKDRKSGEECIGTLITIAVSKAEGWYSRKGSKWQTLPELMLSYRAAAFWARIYAPELSLGIATTEETIDTYGIDAREAPAGLTNGSADSLEASLNGA